MPSKILPDLAPELIIQILRSSDTFADLTSLSSASRKLFIIWKTNDGAICEAVLARVIPCYEQVPELLAAQEKAEDDEHFVFDFQSAVDRVKWILTEADVAAKALDYFQRKTSKLWARNRFLAAQAVLTSAERIEFIRAYYRATTLATLGEGPLPSRLLSPWNILDLKQVRDVMKWLTLFCSGVEQRSLGIRFDYHVPISSHKKIVGIMSGEKWRTIVCS